MLVIMIQRSILACMLIHCCHAHYQLVQDNNDTDLSQMVQRAIYREFIDKLRMNRPVEHDLAISLLANRKIMGNTNVYIMITLYYSDEQDGISETTYKKGDVTIRYVAMGSPHCRCNTAIVYCTSNDKKQSMISLGSEGDTIFGLPISKLIAYRKTLMR